MNRSSKSFIELLRQQPISETYAGRVLVLMTILTQKKHDLVFTVNKALTAVKVSTDDIDAIKDHTLLKEQFESQLTTLEKGKPLFFAPSKLPYQISDNHLTIQHVLDDKGQLYRLCVESFSPNKVTRHYKLNLLEPFVMVVSSGDSDQIKETKYTKRLKVVAEWFKTKREDLKLDPSSTPQEVHDKLTQEHGKEKTQKWYWLEWHDLDQDLFPSDNDPRNFFKLYNEISFSKGNR